MTSRNYHPASVFFFYIASAVLGIIIMMQLEAFLIPFTYAVLLTYLLFPALQFLERKKIPKVWAVLILLVAMILALWILGAVVTASVSGFSSLLPLYQQRLTELLESVLGSLNVSLEEVMRMLNIDSGNIDFGEIGKMILSTGFIQNTATTFSKLFTDMLLVLIFWLFMIAGKEAFEKKLILVFARSSYPVAESITTINKQIQSYVTIKTGINISLGILTSAILGLLGVELALFMGLLTFIVHYIPNIGAIFCTALPVLFALLQFGFSYKVLLVLLLIGGLQFTAGNFIEPRMMGKKMNISPMVALLSLFFWGWVWGIAGMFLAIPFTSIVMIFLRNIPELKSIGLLMQEKVHEGDLNG